MRHLPAADGFSRAGARQRPECRAGQAVRNSLIPGLKRMGAVPGHMAWKTQAILPTSLPASVSGMDMDGWSGLSVRSRSVVAVTEHPFDDDPFKRHGHREDAAAGRPDAGRVDPTKAPAAPWAKSCHPLCGGRGNPFPAYGSGSMIVPEGSHTPPCTRSES